MKTRRLFIVLFLMASLAAGAQTTIKGTVSDKSSGSALQFVTVAVMDKDSNIVSGDVTDEKGQYSVRLAQQGDYLLRISFVGYATHLQAIACKGAKVEVPVVELAPDATLLKAVEVTAKKPLVEQQIDKLVMNVGQSAMANGNNAIDLLRKAPGVSVDKDGNVKLNGQAVQVWIDGRPSQLDGKALEALLRSIDGSTIDKFEIMANPSSKYDAEGQGGIINIKTKRNFKQGLNGTLSASYGGMFNKRDIDQPGIGKQDVSDYLQDQSIDLNLSYRTNKTNTFLQIGESTSQMGVDVDVATQMSAPGIDLDQLSNTRYVIDQQAVTMKLGNDWFINDKNTLGAIVTLPFSHMSQEADSSHNNSLQTINGIPTQSAVSDVSTSWKMQQYAANLNYTHIFDPMKASELTLNADYFHNNSQSTNLQRNYYLNPITAARLDNSSLLDIQSANYVDIYSGKADFQRVVFGKYMMEAGAKWATSITDNNMTQVNSVFGSSPVSGTPQTTYFRYTENIGAAYGTLAAQFNEKWTAKAGLRMEYTNSYNHDNSVKQNHLDPFPTLFVGYTPSMNSRFNLSYTRRIQRPNYDQLNPFKNYLDSYTSNEGNPNLKPNYIDALSLTWGYGMHTTLSLSYFYMKDVITKVPILDPATGNQNLLWDNFGLNTMLSAGLTLVEIPITKNLTWMLSLNASSYNSYADENRALVQGQPVSTEDYNQHSFYGQGYSSLTLRLPKDWKMELDGWATTPVTAGYLQTSWNGMMNFGVKKNCLDNRLTFNFNINDILRTMNGDFEVVGAAGATSHCTQKIYLQKVSVGLQWNFGTAQKPLRHRNVGTLDEASRVGNSSGLNSNQK